MCESSIPESRISAGNSQKTEVIRTLQIAIYCCVKMEKYPEPQGFATAFVLARRLLGGFGQRL